jgi:hypothetical protein
MTDEQSVIDTFGTKRPWVRIPPPRPAKTPSLITSSEGVPGLRGGLTASRLPHGFLISTVASARRAARRYWRDSINTGTRRAADRCTLCATFRANPATDRYDGSMIRPLEVISRRVNPEVAVLRRADNVGIHSKSGISSDNLQVTVYIGQQGFRPGKLSRQQLADIEMTQHRFPVLLISTGSQPAPAATGSIKASSIGTMTG